MPSLQSFYVAHPPRADTVMVDEPFHRAGVHLRQWNTALVEPGQEVVASVAMALERPRPIAFGAQLSEILIEEAQAVGELARMPNPTRVLGETNEPASTVHEPALHESEKVCDVRDPSGTPRTPRSSHPGIAATRRRRLTRSPYRQLAAKSAPPRQRGQASKFDSDQAPPP